MTIDNLKVTTAVFLAILISPCIAGMKLAVRTLFYTARASFTSSQCFVFRIVHGESQGEVYFIDNPPSFNIAI